MASIKPKYSYKDFKNACKYSPNNVFIPKNVLNDAKKIFNLKTRKDLLSFISNDGLEEIEFFNNTTLKKNPYNTNIHVDAYEFRSLYKLGYIAFFYNARTGKWTIKSFHLSDNSNKTMEIAMLKTRLLKKPEGEKNG